MFGHFKAEDFVNLLEGDDLPADALSHLGACARCNATWQSLQAVHEDVTTLESDVPEPDWTQFRSSVRDHLFARSVKRESAVRRWTGWSIKPAMAWGLSLLMAVGVTTGAFLWMQERPAPAPSAPIGEPMLQPAVLNDGDTEAAIWSQTGLFDDLLQLSDAEQEQLQKILEAAHSGIEKPVDPQ